MVAVEAVASRSTVIRVFQGRGNANSRLRVRNACRQLGLPEPKNATEEEQP